MKTFAQEISACRRMHFVHTTLSQFPIIEKAEQSLSVVDLTPFLWYETYYLIKFVRFLGSSSGSSTPAFFPASMHLSSHAIFFASICTICIPSSS